MQGDLLRELTAVVRRADRDFQKGGGSSRHWVRDYFMEELAEAGLRVCRAQAPVMADTAEHTKPASPLPFSYSVGTDADGDPCVYVDAAGHLYLCALHDERGDEQAKQDAAYIVEACNAYPELRAEVERLRRNVERLNMEIGEVYDRLQQAHAQRDRARSQAVHWHDVYQLAMLASSAVRPIRDGGGHIEEWRSLME